MTKKLSRSEVLTYSTSKRDRGTVRRHYLDWRQERGIPERCDNDKCSFYVNPLVWNGVPLKPILDHIDGNSLNNSSNNLRFMCPNCDSQLETRGGGNKNRIQNTSVSGYEVNHGDGRRSATIFLSGQKVTTEMGSIKHGDKNA